MSLAPEPLDDNYELALALQLTIATSSPTFSTFAFCSRCPRFVSQRTKWTCGYACAQMCASAMLLDARYQIAVFGGIVPDVVSLQRHLEGAWRDGFDAQGKEHFGGRLVGGSEWIGATEVAVMFRSCGVLTDIVDFDLGVGSFDAVVEFCVGYFENGAADMPLYLQYQGHATVVIGCELSAAGVGKLIVFDPARSMRRTAKAAGIGPELFRLPTAMQNRRQYQILIFRGVVDEHNKDSRLLDKILSSIKAQPRVTSSAAATAGGSSKRHKTI